ncbi:MAG: hypothetical protein A2169_13390 [Deltaproteobacteria bacterium RBG_13_47_9]|nr:MAG: hypothetical protein A2169_13390 [Deltaproteobacteria bacterium RBG_13_47_9]
MTIEKIIRKLIRKGHPQGIITTHLIEREVEKNMPDFILYFFLELVKSSSKNTAKVDYLFFIVYDFSDFQPKG